MSVLITQSQVVAVLGVDYDSDEDPNLDPYIEIAAAIIDDVVACAVAKGLTISSTRQALLQKWLAAHFYQAQDQGYTSKTTADASASFQGQWGMYLTRTNYGQSALSLDPTGCLNAIANGTLKTVTIDWLGKPPSGQIDYEDRD